MEIHIQGHQEKAHQKLHLGGYSNARCAVLNEEEPLFLIMTLKKFLHRFTSDDSDLNLSGHDVGQKSYLDWWKKRFQVGFQVMKDRK